MCIVKTRAPNNRTLHCSAEEIAELSEELLSLASEVSLRHVLDKVINQDFFEAASNLPSNFVDLLILDPPYNLTKNFNGYQFTEKDRTKYQEWFVSLIRLVIPLLKSTASIYVCSDWRTSVLVAPILEQQFHVRNRITWERDKGRGAKANWKNNCEDIWFCTVSEQYTFNVDKVKLKRRVIAPYRTEDGRPKDWEEESGGSFRLTFPSNIWTDITVPFWSMPENTGHPTQKPEKLIAKLILASSNPGEVVLDPFLGSGTVAVVSKKLSRHFVGVEINPEYCCWSLKRLKMADLNQSIQGYNHGVFWERNSTNDEQKRPSASSQKGLFS